MESFFAPLVAAFGPFAPLYAVGGLGLALICGTLPLLLNRKPDPLERLREERDAGAAEKAGRTADRLRQAKSNERLERYSNFLEPQDAEELSAMRLKLLRAGYRSRDAVRYFHFAQMALGIAGLVLGVVYYYLAVAHSEPTTQKTMMYILGPGMAGYFFPKYWVNKRIEERKSQIEDGFPDALDMLLVCVEAGQSLDQAIIRVSRELRASYAFLAEEFEIVSHEIKAGKDKASVLNDMGERCNVQDISSFVTVLIQSATFGTSIAEALRVYAAEMRDKRVMRAEEKANKLPTKMTLATMGLTVPPLLIILIGPSIVNIQKLSQ